MQVQAIQPPIGPLNSIKICFKNYVQCSGRGRRSEFWYFYGFSTIIMVVITFLQYAFISYRTVTYGYYNTYTRVEPVYAPGFTAYAIFYIVVDIFLFIPLLSASTRRLHDTGRSGLFFLIILIPCGIFALWYFWSIDSVPGANIYGPATKYPLPLGSPLITAQQNIVVASPMNQPIAYPTVQPNVPNVYPGQQPMVANPNLYPNQQNTPSTNPILYPNQQNVPTVNSNVGAYPGQQQIAPKVEPNNYLDKPSNSEQNQFNPIQNQTPVIPPPQNPPNI